MALIRTTLLLCAAHGCVDVRGRPGSFERVSNCGPICIAENTLACVLHELPPRPVGGLWECDEGYELAGARFSWPGGALVVHPEKCTPEGGRNVPFTGHLELQAGAPAPAAYRPPPGTGLLRSIES
jgi:hypothetical protein